MLDSQLLAVHYFYAFLIVYKKVLTLVLVFSFEETLGKPVVKAGVVFFLRLLAFLVQTIHYLSDLSNVFQLV
jgi:hypothetical protein